MIGKLILAKTAGAMLTGGAYAQSIKIGLSGPFTGGSASMGVSMRDGVKLAVSEINKAGGIMGRQIALIERDDEARNELGVQIVQELNKEQEAASTAAIRNDSVDAGPRCKSWTDCAQAPFVSQSYSAS